MSGDYTRFSFAPVRGFSGMRQQQGRVGLDSEFNEFEEILDRRARAETYDIIGDPPASGGRAVVPRTTPTGFEIAVDPATNLLTIGPGRAYVDGILVECFWDLTVAAAKKEIDAIIGGDHGVDRLPYNDQPFFYTAVPNYPQLSGPNTTDLVYLDVWQREVTVYEDDSLLEPALQGPDTATAIQTAWQVKVMSNANAASCETPPQVWDDLTAPTTVRLTAGTGPPPPPATGACAIDPAGGYTGIENRLYRVEIQTSGSLGSPPPAKRAQFKWSRDNASLAARVESITPRPTLNDPNEFAITISSTGRDFWMRFEDGDHIELIDDDIEFAMRDVGRGGFMMKIVAPVDHSAREITVSSAELVGYVVHKGRNPRIRRWDAVDPANDDLVTDVDSIGNGKTFLLEEGISTTFSGAPGDLLRAGDYWVFSARAAEGKIDPPLTDALPRGVLHHYARLGLVKQAAAGVAPVVDDCRKLWPPDTINLLYVGGDGQAALPGAALGAALEVRVVNGARPVVGAKVQFTTLANNGTLPNSSQPYVTTDAQGLASCKPWTLSANTPNQLCTATLLDDNGNQIANQFVHFNASLLSASEHDECCVVVSKDLQDILQKYSDKLGGRGSLCICLLPGEYPLTSIPPFESLTISGRRGAGEGAATTSTIIAEGALTFAPEKGKPNLGTFALNDLELIGKAVPGVLTVSYTERLFIRGCLLERQNASPDHTVLTIGENVGEVRVLDCDIVCQGEARGIELGGQLGDVVRYTVIGDLERARTAANAFVNMEQPQRRGLATRAVNAADEIAPHLDDAAPVGEFLRVAKAQANTINPDADEILAAAAPLATIKLKVAYGEAVNFLDGGSMAWLERNVVTGNIRLYGSYARETVDEETVPEMKRVLGERPPDTGELRMADNIVQRIVVGKDGEETRAIQEGKVFRRLVLESNTIRQEGNEVIASSVALSANLFQAEEVLGYVVADTATVVGNTSERHGTILNVAANDEGDISNVRLRVILS